MLDQLLATLSAQAREADGSKVGPYVRVWSKGKEILPGRDKLAILQGQSINIVDLNEPRERIPPKQWKELLEGKNPIDKVEIWWNAFIERGGYFGETREEYGGEPEPIGRTAAEGGLVLNPQGVWETT